ncbi:hypothetical protein BKA56DRAFT_162193 [Ilyonectria sp. MPI-CAGE-AT-0026]|nr:hypothetical protein BKA56DRAFT_162193 [Ilyonectria sp. MPI-CAGE-AT-0026]
MRRLCAILLRRTATWCSLLTRHSVSIRFHWEMFHRNTQPHSLFPPGKFNFPRRAAAPHPQEVPRPSKAAGNSEHQFLSRYGQTVVHCLASGLVARLLPLYPAGDSRNIVGSCGERKLSKARVALWRVFPAAW